MFSTPISILLACAAAALLLHAVGVWAAFRRTARGRQPVEGKGIERTPLPGLSLLKPIKGLEDDLAKNLQSFLKQEYPGPLEFLFCATDASDSGLQLARDVAAEYPDADCRFLVSPSDFGLNPKVSNMQGGLQAARHEWVLQSDANVRIAPGYLRALMAEALAQNADMVGSLVVGDGERSLGATLENLQLTSFVAPAVCIAQEVANVPCVIGKSMLVRREALERVGGLATIKDILAEDFVLARSFQQHGMRVLMSSLTVTNVNQYGTLDQFLKRHARWLKMRAVVHVPGFLADLIANPTVFPLAATVVSGFDPRLLGIYLTVVVYKVSCDRLLVDRLRGSPIPVRLLWLSPVRDILLAGIWFYAAVSRKTVWRGQPLRIGPGSRLLPRDLTETQERPITDPMPR